MKNCIDTIISVHNGNGWPFYIDTSAKIPDEYCTWSMLESIAELKQHYWEGYEKIKDTSIFKETEDWLKRSFENGKIKQIHEFLASLRDDDDVDSESVKSKARCFYDVSHILSSLALMGSPGTHRVGSYTNNMIFQTPLILRYEFMTTYPKGNDAEDYTLAPMLLKCLSFIFQEHFDKRRKEKDFEKGMGILADNRDQVMLDIYSHIIKNKRHSYKTGIFSGFFCDAKMDKPEKEDYKIDLYYTERVVESLIAFYEYISDKDVAHIFKDDKVDSLLSRKKLPPTKKVNKKIKFAELPALELYSLELKVKHDKVFVDKIILCVQHFLSDLPTFIDCLVKLGAKYENIFLLQKTYKYPERDDVYKYLKNQNCNIEKLKGIISSDQYKTKTKLLEAALKKCKKTKQKLVIIEDGGYFTPILHENAFKKYKKFGLGAVEQTARGIRNDRKVKSIAFPIIDVAKSELKSDLETPEVAQTLSENIRYVITNPEIHWHPKSTSILIIGGGEIGAAVAEKLHDMTFKITVCDNRKPRLNGLKERFRKFSRKIELINRIEDPAKFDLIFGLSGERTITTKIILKCKAGAILASGSSEYYEIDMENMEEMTKEPLKKNVKALKQLPITEYTLKNKKTVRILCNGEPINFQLSSGIPKVSIEPVLMQLQWGAVHVCINPKLKAGIRKFPKKADKEIRDLFFGGTQKR